MLHKKRRNLLICCYAMALVLATAISLKMLYGPWIFRKYVYDPIPKSVKNIRAHRPWEVSGHRYVMRFKISKDDLVLILNSRPFKEAKDLRYNDGWILWMDENPPHDMGLYLYASSGAGPKWFRPGQWNNPKVYRFKEMSTGYRKHLQILIYNEELSEAYLVEYYEGRF